jgi:hypothetical protein
VRSLRRADTELIVARAAKKLATNARIMTQGRPEKLTFKKTSVSQSQPKGEWFDIASATRI